MFIYYAVFSLSIGIALLVTHTVQYKNRKGMIVFAFIAGLPLFIISAIRYNVGTDTASYVRDFYLIKNYGRTYWKDEEGFFWFNKIIGYFTDNGQWLLVICAAIFIGFVFVQIFEDSNDPSLSIFLLFGTTYYFAAQNGVAQTAGCAILFFSIRYIKNREFKKFLLCVIAATLFHYSCILFIVAYFLPFIYKFKKVIWIITAVIFLSSSVLTYLAMQIVSLTPYAKYFGSRYQVEYLGYVSIAINILILLLATLAMNSSRERNDDIFKIYFCLQVVNTWLGSIGQIPYIARRVQWVFGLPVIVLIPLSLNQIQDKWLRYLIKSIVFIGYFAYATILTLQGNHGVLPYKTIFDIK